MAKKRPPLFPNLAAETARKGLSNIDIAESIPMDYQSYQSRYNGKYEFTRAEMLSIRNNNFPKMTLDELFSISAERLSVED